MNETVQNIPNFENLFQRSTVRETLKEKRLQIIGVDLFGIFPELLKGIVFPLFFGKEVNNKIDRI